MKKILIVFGTRPEAVKMCPLVRELQTRRKFEVVVCVTGQHRNMLDSVLDIFDVQPKYDLSIMKQGQTLFDITIRILEEIKVILETEKPDLVLVHGDTSTTFTTALACFYSKIEVGHVEAGLRTYNLQSPFPEEFNRQVVSRIARYHFAPTLMASDNLLNERRNPIGIFVTGNTVIDAFKFTIKADYYHPELSWSKGSRLVLLTVHRRESLGEPMLNIFRAIKRLVERYDDIKVIYPIHLNPKIRELASGIIDCSERIHIIEPLDVVDFHNLLSRSYLVLTDSGGIQEEAPNFGIPVLVLRDTTERPEGVKAGTLKLVGTDQDVIFKNASILLDNELEYSKMSKATNPYGDGFASSRIADILENEK